tara:strand:- start:35 stop:574 length:540 start_codon:yes stop_codon:yes gene_type:complete
MKYLNNNFIFDFDGTLVNLSADWKSLKKELINLSAEYSLRNELSTYERIIKLQMLNKNLYEKLSNIEAPNQKPIYEINDNVIEFIRSKLDNFSIISSNLTSTINLVLEELDLKEKCIEVIGIDKVSSPKPNKNPFEKLIINLKKRNYNFEGQIFYVGDKKVDQEFANNCDLSFIFYKNL